MRGNVAQQLFDFCPHGIGSKERQVLTKMDQTTDKKNVAAAPIDAKVDMVAKLASVDGLKLVSSAAGGTQVFVGSCTADGLRGTSCSLKLIRGDIDHLRRQGDFFCRVSDTQADAGGTLTPSSHGLARVLFHELVALPGDDVVLAVVTVMVPGVSFADVVRTCATGVRTLSFAQSLLLVSSCFKALAQAQAAFGGTFVHQDLKPSNIVFESDPFDLAPDLLGDIPRAALIDLDFSFLAEGGRIAPARMERRAIWHPSCCWGRPMGHATPCPRPMCSRWASLPTRRSAAVCRTCRVHPTSVAPAVRGGISSGPAETRAPKPLRWTRACRRTCAPPSRRAWPATPMLVQRRLRWPACLTT